MPLVEPEYSLPCLEECSTVHILIHMNLVHFFRHIFFISILISSSVSSKWSVPFGVSDEFLTWPMRASCTAHLILHESWRVGLKVMKIFVIFSASRVPALLLRGNSTNAYMLTNVSRHFSVLLSYRSCIKHLHQASNLGNSFVVVFFVLIISLSPPPLLPKQTT